MRFVSRGQGQDLSRLARLARLARLRLRPDTPVSRPEPPQTFGPYLLVERIGAGAAGDLYTAVPSDRRTFGRVVTLERLRPELSASPKQVGAFLAAARAVSLLEHPNIAKVLDYGLVDGTGYVTTEHLEGRDLALVGHALGRARLWLRPLPVAQICVQIARGLEHAHALRDARGRPHLIVHRNINPSTVILLGTGDVKIVGFDVTGAAGAAGRVPAEREGQARRLRYVSPEQVRGEPLDARSDVFSLGVTMWEMLTCRRLFEGETAFAVIGNVLHANIPAPSMIRPNVPLSLERVVMRALERDRSRRYPTAGALAEALDEFLHTRRTRPDAVRYILQALFGRDPASTPTPPPLPRKR
jgi:serine/threonine-protein kinase